MYHFVLHQTVVVQIHFRFRIIIAEQDSSKIYLLILGIFICCRSSIITSDFILTIIIICFYCHRLMLKDPLMRYLRMSRVSFPGSDEEVGWILVTNEISWNFLHDCSFLWLFVGCFCFPIKQGIGRKRDVLFLFFYISFLPVFLCRSTGKGIRANIVGFILIFCLSSSLCHFPLFHLILEKRRFSLHLY